MSDQAAEAPERYPVALRVYDPSRHDAADPDSCAICSSPARTHGRTWHGPGRGWQPYQQPTDDLRKARMKLRRELRGTATAKEEHRRA